MGPLNAVSEANAHPAAARNYTRYFTPFKFERSYADRVNPPKYRILLKFRANFTFYT